MPAIKFSKLNAVLELERLLILGINLSSDKTLLKMNYYLFLKYFLPVFFFRFIIWRKHNKLSLKFFTTPNADLKSGDEVIIGLTLKYTYVNTVFPEKMKHELFAKVFVTAGKIQ